MAYSFILISISLLLHSQLWVFIEENTAWTSNSIFGKKNCTLASEWQANKAQLVLWQFKKIFYAFRSLASAFTQSDLLKSSVISLLNYVILRSSYLALTDNQKRWLVVGIALNKILIPQIRPFVEQGINTEYNNLKISHNIHSQGPLGRLQKWPACFKIRFY